MAPKCIIYPSAKEWGKNLHLKERKLDVVKADRRVVKRVFTRKREGVRYTGAADHSLDDKAGRGHSLHHLEVGKEEVRRGN